MVVADSRQTAGSFADVRRPSRLAGMAGIGVDRMGALADAAGKRDILRFENLDTDVPPPDVATRITGEAARSDAACRTGCRRRL